MKKEKKNPRPVVRKKVPTISNFVRRAVFRKQFESLLAEADELCVSSHDTTEIAGVAGRLLFVVVKAVALEEMEIEEPDVAHALTRMDSVLTHIVMTGVIDAGQRKDLLMGLDYLDALSRAVASDTLDMSWWLLDQLLTKGPGFGDDEIPRILDRITRKHLWTGR